MELQAHLSLADHAVAVGGKLYVNGGSWNLRPPGPMPWALTLEVKVPWHDNNRTFAFRLDLLDGDGRPFEVETPQGNRALFAGGEMRATAGPGLKAARRSSASRRSSCRRSRSRPRSSSSGSSRSTVSRATSGGSRSRPPSSLAATPVSCERGSAQAKSGGAPLRRPEGGARAATAGAALREHVRPRARAGAARLAGGTASVARRSALDARRRRAATTPGRSSSARRSARCCAATTGSPRRPTPSAC